MPMVVQYGPALAKIPRFVEALCAGGIFHRLGGEDKEAVLRALVEHHRVQDEVDREWPRDRLT